MTVPRPTTCCFATPSPFSAAFERPRYELRPESFQRRDVDGDTISTPSLCVEFVKINLDNGYFASDCAKCRTWSQRGDSAVSSGERDGLLDL